MEYTALNIKGGDFAVNAYMDTIYGKINLKNVTKFIIKINTRLKIHELYIMTDDHNKIYINDFKDKNDLATFLSFITVKLNSARIDYRYSNEFKEWYFAKIKF